MSQKSEVTCDRCGVAEYAGSMKKWSFPKIERVRGDGLRSHDLCPRCSEALERFLREGKEPESGSDERGPYIGEHDRG